MASVPAQASMGKTIKAKVQMISGCMDEQTSADVGSAATFHLPANVGPGGAGGACTNAMMSIFYKNDDTPNIPDIDMSWAKLLVEMRGCLEKKKFTQIPQLSTSYPMHLATKFAVKPPGAQRTKALLIGINYVGHTQGQLSGCHNDVKIMKQFIQSQGFVDSHERMRVLLDDGQSQMPTSHNITEAMKWLVADAQPGDALFVHYSGHGSQQRDTNGDEKSGQDQVLVPVDYNKGGPMIVDDWVFETLILPLPEGVHMFAVMDCCHSGSIMDLPFEISVTPELVAQVEAASKLQPAQAQQALQQIQVKPNDRFLEKHRGALAGFAGAAAAGAAAGVCFGGPIGACIGAVCGVCCMAFMQQDGTKALAMDAAAAAEAANKSTQHQNAANV